MTDADPPAPAGTRSPWLALLVLCAGLGLTFLDSTIVNVAIPSISSGLHATLDQIVWVLNSYLVAFAVLLLPCGRLGDYVSPRTLLVLGATLFGVASALCGLAQDVTSLILLRALQGAGGALLVPQAITIIALTFPPERRATAFGTIAGVAGLATVAGPLAGGLVLSALDWRWVFLLNLPIVVLTLLGTWRWIPHLRLARRGAVDWVGAGLLTAGLLAVLFGVTEGPRFAWGRLVGAFTVLDLVLAGAALLAVFALWERFRRDALVPFSLFRARNFSIMAWVNVAVAAGLGGFAILYQLYLQSALGLRPLVAGLLWLPTNATAAVLSPVAGWLSDRTDGRYVVLSGVTLVAVGIGGVGLVAADRVNVWLLVPPLALVGVGTAGFFSSGTAVAVRALDQRLAAGGASGVINTSRQLGFALGGAGVGALAQVLLARTVPEQAAAHASELRPGVREAFLAAVSHLGSRGLPVGRGDGGSLGLLPPPLAAAPDVQALAQRVFLEGYVQALRPALAIVAAVVLAGALTCLALAGQAVPSARRTDAARQPRTPLMGQCQDCQRKN